MHKKSSEKSTVIILGAATHADYRKVIAKYERLYLPISEFRVVASEPIYQQCVLWGKRRGKLVAAYVINTTKKYKTQVPSLFNSIITSEPTLFMVGGTITPIAKLLIAHYKKHNLNRILITAKMNDAEIRWVNAQVVNQDPAIEEIDVAWLDDKM